MPPEERARWEHKLARLTPHQLEFIEAVVDRLVADAACGCPPCSTCTPACIVHVEGCSAGVGVSPGT